MKHNNHSLKRRVIALLTREQIEFLDKLGMDSLFSTGAKLSRVEVIAVLVDVARKLGISGEGIKDKEELLNSIMAIAYSLKE